jgi:hypothetical protein
MEPGSGADRTRCCSAIGPKADHDHDDEITSCVQSGATFRRPSLAKKHQPQTTSPCPSLHFFRDRFTDARYIPQNEYRFLCGRFCLGRRRRRLATPLAQQKRTLPDARRALNVRTIQAAALAVETLNECRCCCIMYGTWDWRGPKTLWFGHETSLLPAGPYRSSGPSRMIGLSGDMSGPNKSVRGALKSPKSNTASTICTAAFLPFFD